MALDAKLKSFVTPSWAGDAAKAVWYGQFVLAAYAMGESPPTVLPPAPTLPAGYQIIADIYMTDFVFEAETSQSHYGLLAANDAGHFVLAVRGTVGWKEWWDDVTSLRLVDCVFKSSPAVHGQVGYGFLQIYNTMTAISRKHQAAPDRQVAFDVQRPKGFAAALDAIMKDHAATRVAPTLAAAAQPTVDVVGHSLGSALVTLYAVDQHSGPNNYPAAKLCTFASPMVGDAAFRDSFDTLFLNGQADRSWRFFISSDIVPMVPPGLLGFVPVDQGIELKLGWDTRWWWPPCAHNLDSYLHVLDPLHQLPASCTAASV